MKRIMVRLSNEARTESDSTPAPTHDPSKTENDATDAAAAAAEGSSDVPDSREPTTSQDDESPKNGVGKGAAQQEEFTPLRIEDPDNHPRALKVLFLSSDTGGGHRASATSLAQQFQNLFPGSSYALCDIVQLDGPPPYNYLVKSYKHLSAHPQQWKLVYNVSNTRAYEMLADVHMKSAMERSARRRIRGYDPDVVVSVHPLMTNVPVLACRNIAKDTGRHLPIFTVCTDLGSAHSMWFASGVEKLFVASDAIRGLAMQRGKVPPEKIVMSGLPIRRDFAVQAEKMGERHSKEGTFYQKYIREELGLGEYADRKTVLVMGGGEGCGRLSNIVDALYLQFMERGMDALILVVCGRNEALKKSLAQRDWEGLRSKYVLARISGADFKSCTGLSDVGCIDGGVVASQLRRIISSPSMGGAPFISSSSSVLYFNDGKDAAVSAPNSRTALPSPSEGEERKDNVEVVTKSCGQRNKEAVSSASSGQKDIDLQADNSLVESSVKVLGLGFITNMADYMVATDVLVTKAGPGTIAEAASLSLPVMLTSFLPGQEEGNVDYVIDGGFGAFVSDEDPHGISDVVAGWLLDEAKLRELSNNAHRQGAPDAAAEIVETIGESALKWKKVDESHHTEAIRDGSEDGGAESGKG